METHIIKDLRDFETLKEYLKDKSPEIQKNKLLVEDEAFDIKLDHFNSINQQEIKSWLNSFKYTNASLVFGKNPTKNIVSCEVDSRGTTLFIEKNGEITETLIPNKYWVLAKSQLDAQFQRLEGNLDYKWIKLYTLRESYLRDKGRYKNQDTFSVYDPKEASMLLNGFTYFKGMKPEDVSILSFDIEATGLAHNESARVLMISNTYRNLGKLEKKIFSCDEFNNDKEMIDAWCLWVREKNPSVITNFNIFGYDFPYLNFCAKKNLTELNLGRDGSSIVFDSRESKFRKDGSQDYLYKRCFIFGREIVDTMFVAYHFDYSRKYERYALKEIIKHEGLAREGRQYYDAKNIGKDWSDVNKRKLIKEYGQDDADENLKLFDLMIAPYFYLANSVPKSFQTINCTATGSQINSLLIRSYLQHGHSLPATSPAERFPGAISDGYPGIYKNVFKVDIVSLYPSIMLQYKIYDVIKDPKAHFLQMVEYFTNERLDNKAKSKDKQVNEELRKYYSGLEQAEKIVINSSYGLLGSTGLLFNSPANAEMVTEKGREILKKAILWATGNEYEEKQEESEI